MIETLIHILLICSGIAVIGLCVVTAFEFIKEFKNLKVTKKGKYMKMFDTAQIIALEVKIDKALALGTYAATMITDIQNHLLKLDISHKQEEILPEFEIGKKYWFTDGVMTLDYDVLFRIPEDTIYKFHTKNNCYHHCFKTYAKAFAFLGWPLT